MRHAHGHEGGLRGALRGVPDIFRIADWTSRTVRQYAMLVHLNPLRHRNCPAPWLTRPTQCLPMDKYLVPIPGPANSQGFARDTASNPPGIFHNSKNCRLGYFPNCRLNFPAAFSV